MSAVTFLAMALAAVGLIAVPASIANGADPTFTRVDAKSAATRTVGGVDGPGWNIWSNGHIEHPVEFGQGQRHRIVVSARANSDRGDLPMMELRIDGQPRGTAEVTVNPGWAFAEYSFDVSVTPGRHDVAVAFINDTARPGQNLDLVIDWFEVRPGSGEDPPPTPPIDPPPAPTPTVSVPVPSTIVTTSSIPSSTTVPTPSSSSPTQPTTAPSTTTPSSTRPTTSVPPTTSPPTTAPPTTSPPTTGPPAPGGGSGRSAHVPSGYDLTWNDEFDSLSLDLNGDGGERWATWWVDWNVLSLAGNGDQCMKAHPDHTGTGGPRLGLETHRVEGGNLSLFGRPIPQNRRSQFWGYEAACGMISGEKSHSQTYGYWETRMRITNVSQGHHWAIWLLPANDTWPPEVDILEVVGDAPGRDTDERRFHFTGHYNTGGGKKADMAFRNAPRAADDWYTLGLEWTPDAVIWYLDGVEVHRMWNFIGDDPNYFLISPEISGNWPGPTGSGTTWPMAMEVDYVRIYQR